MTATVSTAAVPGDAIETDMAVPKPLLPADAVVCTGGGSSIGQAVKDLGLEHHPVVTSKGRTPRTPAQPAQLLKLPSNCGRDCLMSP